jgi:hypothetical protein
MSLEAIASLDTRLRKPYMRTLGSTYAGLCRLNQASLSFDSQLWRETAAGDETQFGVIRKAGLCRRQHGTWWLFAYPSATIRSNHMTGIRSTLDFWTTSRRTHSRTLDHTANSRALPSICTESLGPLLSGHAPTTWQENLFRMVVSNRPCGCRCESNIVCH